MVFRIKQNDTTPALETTLRDGSTPVDISGYNDVRFIVQDEYERIVIDDNTSGDVTVLDPAGGVVQYTFDATDTANVGTYYGEWEVEYGDGSIETFPTIGYMEIEVIENLV